MIALGESYSIGFKISSSNIQLEKQRKVTYFDFYSAELIALQKVVFSRRLQVGYKSTVADILDGRH